MVFVAIQPKSMTNFNQRKIMLKHPGQRLNFGGCNREWMDPFARSCWWSSREIVSCMSWVGRKNALTLVKHMKDNLDTRINFNSLFDLLKAAHESKV